MSNIKVAFIGTGGIAGRHARAANQRSDVSVVGVMDINAPRVREFADKQFAAAAVKPAVFEDAALMLKKTKPDAVVINTPHTLHYEQCLLALKRHCHVLVEKPMVTELKHALALAKRVAKAGKILCVAYNTPCSARLFTLREYVRQGTFGKLKLVSLDISQPWYHFVKNTWRMDPKLSGGGMAYDSGAHVLNSLVWTVESEVTEVSAWVDNLDVPVDINSSINIRFASGTIANVTISGETPSGASGVFLFEKARVEIDPWGAGAMRVRDSDQKPAAEPAMLGTDSTPFDNFVDAILGKAEPRTNPRNGVLQSQLMDAVYKSARTGRPARPRPLK